MPHTKIHITEYLHTTDSKTTELGAMAAASGMKDAHSALVHCAMK